MVLDAEHAESLVSGDDASSAPPTAETVSLKVMNLVYTDEEEGVMHPQPIIHLYCRDADRREYTAEVEGFRPYFYVTYDLYEEHRSQLVNDLRVFAVDTVDDDGQEFVSLDHQRLVRITTLLPKHVRELRQHIEDEERGWGAPTWEADVFFTTRFLISAGIKRGVAVPIPEDFDYEESGGHLGRVHARSLIPLDEDDVPDVPPRVVTVDIEVESSDGTVPDPEQGDERISAITAHDNYDDELAVWVLAHEKWSDDARAAVEAIEDEEPSLDCLQVYDSEGEMMLDFVTWLVEKDADLHSGWFSDGFDYPYIINRAYKLGVWDIQKWSPFGTVFVGDGFDGDVKPVVKGVSFFDMLEGYKKTQWKKKRSYKLSAIAKEATDLEKLDVASPTADLSWNDAVGQLADVEDGTDEAISITQVISTAPDEYERCRKRLTDIDFAWRFDPVLFTRYNIRDVEAVLAIEENCGVLDLFDNLRRVTGAEYGNCMANFDLIDTLFLRRALEQGVALPTASVPDVGHYHGAYVFNPKPGKSRNAVYPDLASLYPYTMWAFNLSPETVVGFEEDLAASEYTEEDCFTVYVDPRPEEVKKESDDVVEKTLYVLKPDVKEGFVRDAVGAMIDMKYEYKHTALYDAVKRVTNSTYGVMGDSNTRGRGFRLFDWRIAESITMAGRTVLEFTAEEFTAYLRENGYPESELIGGDTDSVITSIPSAESWEEALDAAHAAAEYVNTKYDVLVTAKYNFDDTDEHKFEVEVEALADSIFFLRDFKSKDPNAGVKKRYAQRVVWNDKKGWDVDEVTYKGFELVRSDCAVITATAQKQVLEYILYEDDPKMIVYDYLEDLITSIRDGEVPLEDLGIPSAINKNLDEYGSETNTPHPQYRGAKYAQQYIRGEDPGIGSKPLLFYIEKVVGNDYPHAYTATTAENERPVDAIAVEDVGNIPEELVIDIEKQMEKVLKNPLNRIVRTLGWEWDDIATSGRQFDLSEFM